MYRRVCIDVCVWMCVYAYSHRGWDGVYVLVLGIGLVLGLGIGLGFSVFNGFRQRT